MLLQTQILFIALVDEGAKRTDGTGGVHGKLYLFGHMECFNLVLEIWSWNIMSYRVYSQTIHLIKNRGWIYSDIRSLFMYLWFKQSSLTTASPYGSSETGQLMLHDKVAHQNAERCTWRLWWQLFWDENLTCSFRPAMFLWKLRHAGSRTIETFSLFGFEDFIPDSNSYCYLNAYVYTHIH